MTTESVLIPEPPTPQKILIIDPSGDKAASLVKSLGHVAMACVDAFEGHALVDGATAVLAAHPAAAPIYPRLRTAGIPLIASFAPKQPAFVQSIRSDLLPA